MILHKSSQPQLASILLLGFIVAAGSLLRFLGLGFQSLWNDELDSLLISTSHDLMTVINQCVSTTNPPGFNIITRMVVSVLGDSEWALRFPSAVFGIGAILSTYLLGVRLYSRKEGIIASALMAFMYFPIYYSQEARPYSALLFFSSLATYFWISLLFYLTGKRGFSKLEYIGYVICAWVSMYLHYFGLLLIFFQGIALVLVCIRKPKKALIAAGMMLPMVLAYLPWIPFLFETSKDKDPTYLSGSPAVVTVFLYSAFNHSELIKHIFLAIGVVVLGQYVYRFYRSRTKNWFSFDLTKPSVFLGLWFMMPIAGGVVVSRILYPVLSSRNLIIILPALYLIFARTIVKVTRHHWIQVVIASCFVMVSLVDLLVVKNYYHYPIKEQFREAVAYVVDHDNNYPDSWIVAHVWSESYLNYYFTKLGSNRKVEYIAGTQGDIAEWINNLHARNPSFVWFISAHRQPENEFLLGVGEHLELIETQQFVGASVRLYKNPQR